MKYWLIIASLIIKSTLFSQTVEVYGLINENTLWNADTIIITDNVLVQDSITLEIAPGTVILADFQKRIEVEGTLKAIGSPDNYIIFSALDTLGFADTTQIAGSWDGIHFDSIAMNNDTSVIDYCILEYGKAFVQNDGFGGGGAVFADNVHKLRISNSIIQHNYAQRNGGGIFINENSFVLIQNNLIKNNSSNLNGGGITFLENSGGMIKGNFVIENVAYSVFLLPIGFFSITGRGGGICISSTFGISPIVMNNIICNNLSVTGSMYESSFNTLIISNIICNNKGLAAGIFNGHQIGNSSYINNTIINNEGVGIQYSSDNLLVRNNVVYGNVDKNSLTEANTLSTLDATPDLTYNNIGGDLIPGDGNINESPAFANPTPSYGLAYNGYEADWSLTENSLEINAGTTEGLMDVLPEKDAYGNDRIIDGEIDMGAVEYDVLDFTGEVEVQAANLSVYPNPFSGQVWIENKGEYQPMVMEVWNMMGQKVWQQDFNQMIQVLETSSWASGQYVITIMDRARGQIFYKKTVVKVEKR